MWRLRVLTLALVLLAQESSAEILAGYLDSDLAPRGQTVRLVALTSTEEAPLLTFEGTATGIALQPAGDGVWVFEHPLPAETEAGRYLLGVQSAQEHWPFLRITARPAATSSQPTNLTAPAEPIVPRPSAGTRIPRLQITAQRPTDDGGRYIAGKVIGDVDGQISAGFADAFLARENAAGHRLWTRLVGTSAADEALALLNHQGVVAIAGSTSGALPGQTHLGLCDAFVAAFSEDGERLWIKSFGSPGLDMATCLESLPDGFVVGANVSGEIAGRYWGGLDALVTVIDLRGNVVVQQQWGSAGNEWLRGLQRLEDGQLASFGETTGDLVTQNRGGDAFWTIHDTQARPIWTHQSDGAAFERATSISQGATGLQLALVEVLPALRRGESLGNQRIVALPHGQFVHHAGKVQGQ